MFYAINALQQGNESAAKRIFAHDYPKELVGRSTAGVDRANEWELETLCNEVLITSRTYQWLYAWHPRLNCRDAHAAIRLIHILRDLENEEYAYWDHDIRYEMRRIVNRQFEWQRGFFNKALAYRTSVMFGGVECLRYLHERYQLSLDDINYVGFVLSVGFANAPMVSTELPTTHVGLEHTIRDRVYSLISADMETARSEANLQRHTGRSIAFRPSILRRYPVLRRRGTTMLISPLPQLISYRTTVGIYYDLVPGGGAIRNEIGRKFEEYCFLLLKKVLHGDLVRREFSYVVRDRQESPDLLISTRAKTWCIAECKAVKMTFDAKFGEGELIGRGYDELAKAVFQIWRYVSHSRRGLVADKLHKHPIGLVIALDDWMTMALGASEEVLKRARQMCLRKDAEITGLDQISIIFAEIGSLENVLLDTSTAGFKRHVRKALLPEFKDWLLGSIPVDAADAEERPFPFDDLATVVPWWGRVDRMRTEKARRTRKRRGIAEDYGDSNRNA